MPKPATLKPEQGRSQEAQAYRRWYKTYRWQQHRKRHLTANPLCTMCEKQGRVTAGTVADHIKAHKGDPALFWDVTNLQSLCAPCHNSAKQSQEHSGRAKIAIGADGWPID